MLHNKDQKKDDETPESNRRDTVGTALRITSGPSHHIATTNQRALERGEAHGARGVCGNGAGKHGRKRFMENTYIAALSSSCRP